MDYDTKKHSQFLIRYHIICVCKYRKRLLLRYGEEVKRIFEQIATASDFSFEAMEVDRNHIHCLIKSEPQISPLSIVGKLKQESTFQLWRSSEAELKRAFWKARTIWRDEYFCCTIGKASQETIRRSIENQG
jgi:putative transposase